MTAHKYNNSELNIDFHYSSLQTPRPQSTHTHPQQAPTSVFVVHPCFFQTHN